jgi:hypothetical protein
VVKTNDCKENAKDDEKIHAAIKPARAIGITAGLPL